MQTNPQIHLHSGRIHLEKSQFDFLARHQTVVKNSEDDELEKHNRKSLAERQSKELNESIT